jgi:superfamily II DNA or RNA helicase
VTFYTHRKSLFSQTLGNFRKQGIDLGVRASGYDEDVALQKPLQMAMLPSERAAFKAGTRQRHQSKLVIVDEGHLNATGFAAELLNQHKADGATVVSMTATPLGMGDLYDELAILCKNSQLREAGGIVLADVHAPDMFDMRHVRRVMGTEFNPSDVTKRLKRPQVVGSIIEHYQRINRDRLPTVCFAPDVAGSIYLVDEFTNAGIKSAHVDGTHIYRGEHDSNGKRILYESTISNREELFKESYEGKIEIISNRFVMREGIDMPHLGHCILACAFGSPQSYIQSVGRVIRAYPGLDKVSIQDHGGNFLRPGLGSPNLDRDWILSETTRELVERKEREREDGVGNGVNDAPVACPICHKVTSRLNYDRGGSRCMHCGHHFGDPRIRVFMADGQLKLMKIETGRLGSGQTSATVGDPQKLWNKVYFPFKNSKSVTFWQMVGIFSKNNPGYRVDLSGSVTKIVHVASGTSQKVGYIPAPNSVMWKQTPSQVDYRQLQYRGS